MAQPIADRKNNPRGEFDLCTFAGYALFLFQSGLLPVSPASPGAVTNSYTSVVSAVLQAGSILSLVFVVVLIRVARQNPRKILLGLAYMCNIAGFSLECLNELGFGGLSASTLGQLLVGAGFSFVLVIWVDIFSNQPHRCFLRNLLGASMAAAILSVIDLTVFPFVPHLPFALALTITYLILLAVADKRWPSLYDDCPGQTPSKNPFDAALVLPSNQKQKENEDSKPLGASADSLSLKKLLKDQAIPLVCCSLLVMVGPTMAFGVFSQTRGTLSLALAVNIGLLLASSILMFYCLSLKRTVGITQLYFTAFPCLATALLLLTFLGARAELAFAVISHTVYNLVSLVIIMESVRLARSAHTRATLLYSVFSVVVYATSTVGAWIGAAVGNFFIDSTLVTAMALVIVYALSIVALPLLRSELRRRKLASLDSGTQADIRDPIGEACLSLASRYDLTPREAEILDHIAHGRNVPAIAEKMLLSKETIRTHVKGLYRTLKVHSRQEVIDLIEKEEGSEIDA